MKNNHTTPLVGRSQSAGFFLGKFLWLVAIAIGVQSAQAQFSLPLYERFSYTNNEPLGATGGSSTNWSWGNSASGSSAHPQTNSSLSYIGLPVDTTAAPPLFIGPGGLLAGTGTGKVRGANFSNPVTNTTIYASFLLNVRSLIVASTDRLIWGLGSATTGSGADGGIGVWLDPSGHLKVSKNSTTAAGNQTTYSLVASNTYLVVVRYKVNTVSSTDDEADLWLNPPLGNATIPTPTILTTSNADAATFNSMTFNGNAPNHVFWMDEIRVGTNWTDVTPASTSWAGGVYNATGGGSGCGSDSFAIGLSGSDSGVNYLLYTNGVLSDVSVAGTGSSISFGGQTNTATYTVLATNTTDATIHWMNGNAVVSVLAAPVITSQPASALAATNSSVVFIASVAGSGLNYQWYRNGAGLANGGNISGVATPVLSISPATTAEIATTTTGYYCIITNACGNSATTVTNALTLHASGKIVWQGTPTNLWDLATTANWTNSAGAAVAFNPGDNVTLDDTYQNAILAVQSPYVSPGVISYVGSLNMFINGNGNIFGNGNISGTNSSLLVNGSGSLSISNANTFGGGTTVSNGTLKVATFNGALGYGTIRLAGGTFELVVSGSGVGNQIPNNFVVSENSTLQYDGNGGNACNLGGTLTGIAGKTLTVYSFNNTTTPLNWIRFTTSFTNDTDIVLSSLGTAVEFVPTPSGGGTQVFNGTISGNFGRVRAATGTVILNGTNTYNDMSCYGGGLGQSGISLLLNGGSVGFGANSVSTTPPTIDSSPAGNQSIGIEVTGNGSSMFASGGTRTIGNPIIYTSATNSVTVSFNGSNSLTFSGPITLSGADGTGNTNRILSFANTALTTFSGIVGDGGLTCGMIKTGIGTLDLNGANTYTGSTIVSNGLLAGIGSIAGPVTVAPTGSIGAGTASVGTLAINSDLILNGNGFFKLNKSVSPSNDFVSVSGTLTNFGTGTITLTNIGVPALAVGDTFFLFNKALSNAVPLTIVGGGMNWTNKLAINGSIQALSVAIANYPTNITPTLNGSNLQITWPATHLGWMMEAQTNPSSIGLSTNWFTISNTATQLGYTNTVDFTKGGVFYRLRKP